MATRIGAKLRSASIALLFGSVLANSIAFSASAKDPFSGRTAKPIGDKTEAVFNAMFKEGDYIKAQSLIGEAEKAEPNEPLLHALKASLLFANSPKEDDTHKGDSAGFLKAAQDTKRAAQELVKTDTARGNLYLAVGNFLESAHVVATKGIVQGTPDALGKLTSAFQNLGEAEKADPNDPEFNMIKGTMDLLLAVNINLPLSDANAAIDRVTQKSSPKYVADRVLAWGYRDMNQLDKAISAVDRAKAQTPDNPELHYLKGQILFKQGKKAESVPFFKQALKNPEKLPKSLQGQFCHDLAGADPAAAQSVSVCK
jgi:tetratricopeptide (TPR) repeat protein